jgi:hypothetical protein
MLCRAQEDFHRLRAASTTLENVRLLSVSAAAAWAKEASAAESREARQLRVRDIANAGVAAKTLRATPDDLSSSENPDRGLANP